jgi:hypothetical protein
VVLDLVEESYAVVVTNSPDQLHGDLKVDKPLYIEDFQKLVSLM